MNLILFTTLVALLVTTSYSEETSEGDAKPSSLIDVLGLWKMDQEGKVCGGKQCKQNEICEHERPAHCPCDCDGDDDDDDDDHEHPGCKPKPVCKRCCPEGCKHLNCHDGTCVYQKHKSSCSSPPCCPMAKCVKKHDLPSKTCANVRCSGGKKCRMMQKEGCHDEKRCIYPSCSVYATGYTKYCP